MNAREIKWRAKEKKGMNTQQQQQKIAPNEM